MMRLKYNLDRILVYLFTHTRNINFSVRHIFSRFIKVGVFCHTYWMDKTYKLRKKWRRWRVFKNLLNANYYFFQLIFPVIFLFNVAFTQKFKKAFLQSFSSFCELKRFRIKRLHLNLAFKSFQIRSTMTIPFVESSTLSLDNVKYGLTSFCRLENLYGNGICKSPSSVLYSHFRNIKRCCNVLDVVTIILNTVPRYLE